MTLDFLRQVYYVAWGDMRFMRHNFANILIMSIMSPILYLIAFGFGLRTGETSIGVSYVAFVIPGIAALSSLSSSFSSTSTCSAAISSLIRSVMVSMLIRLNS